MKLNLLLSRKANINSYTITEGDTVYYINDTIHHLSYNTNYSINITVVNCFGEQNSTLLSISEGIYECRITFSGSNNCEDDSALDYIDLWR